MRKAKESELGTIEQERSSLGKSEKVKEDLNAGLNQTHKALGDQVFELEGIINASFPRVEDEPIRRAILCGDVQAVEKLLGCEAEVPAESDLDVSDQTFENDEASAKRNLHDQDQAPKAEISFFPQSDLPQSDSTRITQPFS